jgi:transcriptional regulator with XRE-family HTH domain
MKTIGQKIKELRKENNLTQKQLAKILGISETGFASWEQGLSEPNTESIAQLCRIFNVSADYLLNLENEDGTKNYNIANSFNNSGIIGNVGNIQIGNKNNPIKQ